MRIRRPTKPPVTWAFKESTPGGGLCTCCIFDGDRDNCPKMKLTKVQQDSQTATRCVFHISNQKLSGVI